MKLTILSHASFLLEDGDVRLMTDPWIIGSCYWRSWWNYPYIKNIELDQLKPSHIYLTHLHWDHYHLPTLRKLTKSNPKILIPKAISNRFKKDIEELSLEIVEIDHCLEYKLTNKINLFSYQINPFFLDSTLIIKSPDYSILNLNDSKPYALTSNHIKKICPNPTFLLRSYSSASPIPICIDFFSNQFGINKSKLKEKEIINKYCDRFFETAKFFESEYAIPFASNHCYLRPDTIKHNQFAVSPELLQEHYLKKNKKNNKEKLLVLKNGMSLVYKKGELNLSQLKNKETINCINDYFSEKKIKVSIQKQIEMEKKSILKKRFAEKYFINYLNSLSIVIRLILPRRIDYILNGNKKEFVTIFPLRKKILFPEHINEYPKSEDHILISSPTLVFNDCNIKHMHNTATPSKIIRFLIKNNKVSHFYLFAYLSSLDMYENDIFPIRNLLKKRNLKIIFSRWRELFDVLGTPFMIFISKFGFKNSSKFLFPM